MTTASTTVRLLVTGATGYVGSRLVDALLASDNEVVVASRSPKRLSRYGWSDDVTAVELTGPVKVVTDGEGNTHRARAVILAMGSAYRELGLPDEKRLSGHGVSWCATCDGFFFREQDIVVVGGGDSAVEEATFLTKFARSVTIVHRRDELRASKIMADRAHSNDKIRFAWNSEVAAIHGDDKVTGLTLRDTVTGETREIEATGLFVAIGHDPRSELLGGQVDLVVYSLASPVRKLPGTGEVVRSALKPIGEAYTSTAIDTNKDAIVQATIEPATEQEIEDTVTVMGGQDWELWIDALDQAGVLADGAVVAGAGVEPPFCWRSQVS